MPNTPKFPDEIPGNTNEEEGESGTHHVVGPDPHKGKEDHPPPVICGDN